MRLLLAVLALLLAGAFTLSVAPEARAKGAEFVGVKECGKCHKKDKEGKQLGIWEESKHSKAFENLGSAKAKERAKKVGVNSNPQESEACLICHVTGYGAPESQFSKKFAMEDGVQCESCHGAGSEYKSKKIMKQITDERGAGKKGKSPTAEKVGLTIPGETDCKVCHAPEIQRNGKTFKNPSYEEFKFKERWEKIKHPVPS